MVAVAADSESGINLNYSRAISYDLVRHPIAWQFLCFVSGVRYVKSHRVLGMAASLLVLLAGIVTSSEARTDIPGEPVNGLRQEPWAMFLIGVALLGLALVARNRSGKTGSKSTSR
jgi:hypothetical protein